MVYPIEDGLRARELDKHPRLHGLTNREIGTRLFVSPRTVQTHVPHILQKTGLRSRVEIARAVETRIN